MVAEGEAAALEFTPTWIVAAVCSIIVLLSLVAERCLHYLGKKLKKKNQKPLYEALLKVKEELMLLGFISLLLTVFQGMIQRTCIPAGWTDHMLPCQRPDETVGGAGATEGHFGASGILGRFGRRLLSEGAAAADHCQKKGKVPLLSLEAIHQLHIFIFVLAITHVVFSVTTMLLGGTDNKVTHVRTHEFIKKRFKENSVILSWLHSFGKQFYGSVSKSDYTTMRLGFIKLLLAIGTKLEHVIAQLAHDVAEKHSAIVGEVVVKPSDDHFWFGKPRIVLFLIHFILFQNAFEIAFFFWILVSIVTHHCKVHCMWVVIQLLCSYSTLPLYAIVTQMGSCYKKEIFNEHVQQGVLGWAQKVKMKKGLKGAASKAESIRSADSAGPSVKIEMAKAGEDAEVVGNTE
ncbi:hypothetical protein HU200_008098 [Digitaria exilis]|uniref:MLO-like protein n=1 Tax=Digitaria exilis TaxID=1010633 RepID=A0A835FLA0_9POAL|nr:hypothetical protein HU200_008098 [Digitaria exilis]